MYFQYGETEISYLKAKDSRLGQVIEELGHIYREVDPDLYSAVLHQIIGQQISSKALATVWHRLQDSVENVNASNILTLGEEGLHSLGISYRKEKYITDFSRQILQGEFDPSKVLALPDKKVIEELTKVKGIGVWTAEMILLFCLQRPNVFSFDDLAIQRGLRMVYHHRKIDRKLFEKYRCRFSPYCSVASLYLWAVPGGAIPEM